MKCICKAGLMAVSALSAGLVWAQASTATGTFLGEKVNPVMAVELDAAPSRSQPSSTPASTGTGTDKREATTPNGAASGATYTGIESSESMGSRIPQPPGTGAGNERK